jgi:uncharacterized membrane protein
MKNTIFATALLLAAQAKLTAQNPVNTLRTTGVNDTQAHHMIHQIEQNALAILLGVVVVMIGAWIVCIGKACSNLRNNNNNTHVTAMLILMLVAPSLCFFGTGCKANQIARSMAIQSTKEAEGGQCVCHAAIQSQHYYNQMGMHNQYPYYNNTQGVAMPFCKQCGQRIYKRNQ